MRKAREESERSGADHGGARLIVCWAQSPSQSMVRPLRTDRIVSPRGDDRIAECPRSPLKPWPLEVAGLDLRLHSRHGEHGERRRPLDTDKGGFTRISAKMRADQQSASVGFAAPPPPVTYLCKSAVLYKELFLLPCPSPCLSPCSPCLRSKKGLTPSRLPRCACPRRRRRGRRILPRPRRLWWWSKGSCRTPFGFLTLILSVARGTCA